MAANSGEGVRLKPRDTSDPTAGPSTFLPEEYPDIAFADVTPNAARHGDSEGRTREQGTQTRDEAGGHSPPEGKKPRNLVVCIDGTANQFSENVRLSSNLQNRSI